MKEEVKINFWKWLFGLEHIIVALFLLGFIGFGIYDAFINPNKRVAFCIIGAFTGIFTLFCFQIRKHWKEINSNESS